MSDDQAQLEKILVNVELAVEYGREANERLGVIERRLTVIEHHMKLNGEQPTDTEPAPATQPENARPGEG